MGNEVMDIERGNNMARADFWECLLSMFEQLPQKYQMIFFSACLLGGVGLGAYAIYNGYGVTKTQDGWTFNRSSTVEL